MNLTIEQIHKWMKENKIEGASIPNIYKRYNSGNDWGFIFEKGLIKVPLKTLEEKWRDNPPFVKRGRPKK